jgi:GH18 family chitinase
VTVYIFMVSDIELKNLRHELFAFAAVTENRIISERKNILEALVHYASRMFNFREHVNLRRKKIS